MVTQDVIVTSPSVQDGPELRGLHRAWNGGRRRECSTRQNALGDPRAQTPSNVTRTVESFNISQLDANLYISVFGAGVSYQ